MTTKTIRGKSYSELIKLPTFEARLNYLKTNSKIGDMTFGSSRYLNQQFYNSRIWMQFRNKVILRDFGCDLGLEGYDINDNPIIHHIEEINETDFLDPSLRLLNIDNVITASKFTHRQIHFGTLEQYDPNDINERRPSDTCPWKGVNR